LSEGWPCDIAGRGRCVSRDVWVCTGMGMYVSIGGGGMMGARGAQGMTPANVELATSARELALAVNVAPTVLCY
jgi:hypothetical protein